MKVSTEWIAAIMRDEGVGRIEVDLSGGGDSGGVDEVRLLPKAGRSLRHDSEHILSALGQMKVPVRAMSLDALSILHEHFHRDAYAEGDYVNNEGGSVQLAYEIDAEDLELVEAFFTPGESYDDDYDEEYDEELEDPDTVAQDAPGPQ
jgi:hypothetical protein